ncbi:MAG: hypothetical protein H6735_14520 [Alphaproteobacteria bacterium]|nr:hypothetical protein [Alphaproteobacteria bacterium]
MRTLPLFLLVACATEATAPSGATVTIEGTWPDGIDRDEVLAQLPDGAFGVVADPGTGDVATLSADGELLRVASAEFSVAVPAACPDCIDPLCNATARTLTITLSHDSGTNGETYEVQTASATNYAAPAVTPSTFSTNVGATAALSITGTLPSCAPFAYYFDVIAQDQPKRVFVADIASAGDLGGVTGADAACATAASNAGLSGTFVAWLGTSGATAPSRFTGNGPWARTGDGAIVANDLADLLDGSLGAAIRNDADGNPVSGVVWTGALSDGTTDTTCTDWTSAGFDNGTFGDPTSASGTWTASVASPGPCAFFLAGVYCFEQ